MPFVMRHTATGSVLACVQRNGYELAYYGIVLWETAPGVAQMAEALAGAGVAADDPGGRVQDWEPLALSEHEAKMANVKLRNDPRMIVRYRDGTLSAQPMQE